MSSGIPTPPEYTAAPRKSINVVNHREEFAKLDAAMAQIEVLTNIVIQLTNKVNAAEPAKRAPRKTTTPETTESPE